MAIGALYVDRVTAEVVAAMEHAGIPTILLKGPSIARWLYPAGGRTYGDTDILVPPSRFADAASVLTSLGFRERYEGFHPRERDPGTVELSFTRPAASGARPGGKVDLHRNLGGVPVPDELLWETFDAGCDTMPVGGIEVRVLNRTGVALHIVLHAMQQGFGLHTGEDLRRAVECLPFEGWRGVALVAQQLGVTAALGLGLRSRPQGSDIADRLRLPQVALGDSVYASSPAWAARGALTLSHVRSAATVGEKASLVRRALVPSPAKVRYMAGTPSLASGYRRYWRGLVVSMGPALRHVVRHQAARGHRGRRVRAVRRVLTSDPWLLLEAGLCLGGARLAISILPFRWMTWALRQRQGEARDPAEGDTSPQRQRVARALRRVSHRMPGGSHCLAQALAGKQMLRRRGIGSTLHIGVAKEVQTHLEAHAWLRSGDLTVTGGDGLERFAVIATFSDRCTGVTGVTRR